MNNLRYYSKPSSVTSFPGNEVVLECSLLDFEKAIDTLFRLADVQSTKKHFQKPMNF